MMYSKLFASLVHSSLWSQMDHVRLLFITLLALADRDGIVYGSRTGLMRAAMIDLDVADEHDPWSILMGPDDDSSDLMRNPENEGRRIREVPGGFEIINYTYYRGLRDAEDRKAQNREAQRRHRDKISPDKPRSAGVSQRHDIESESESEINTKIKKKEEEGAKGSRPTCVEDWLKELEADPTYRGINIKTEYGKMCRWCEVHGKQPTQRRFVNWINKADRPMLNGAASKQIYGRNYPGPIHEPSEAELANAREIAKREVEKLKKQLTPSAP